MILDRVMTDQELEEMHSINWWHRIPVGTTTSGERVITPGEVFHGPDGQDWATSRFGLPRTMKGLRVADIGGWDGYFAFEAERRGAESVTIFDVDPERGGNWGGTTGFEFARRMLDSKISYINDGIYEVTPEEYGQFDVTFFFGVLYHLKEPLTALERLFAMTAPGGYSLIETARARPGWMDENIAALVFMPGFENDPTNYYYPTPAGLEASLRHVGYRIVSTVFDDGFRQTVMAAR